MIHKVTPDSSIFQVVILHLDLDAFFASVEQADNPSLQGLPVIIGQSLRGVVTAASYAARRYGVHSAMPIVQAKKLCPHAIFLPGRMHRYHQVSQEIMSIIRAHCPVVEQASIDEAYVDISGTKRALGTPKTLALSLKKVIKNTTGLSCSIGIAPNKFLAKVASAWKKPDGLTIIEPDAVFQFLAGLSLHHIPGVGQSFLEELGSLGVQTIPDILSQPKSYWAQVLGKRGADLYDRAQGIDHRPVLPKTDPLSCSAENTLEHDTLGLEMLKQYLLIQAERVGHELRALGKKSQTITLKIKFQDFSVITRSKTLHRPTDITHELYTIACTLLFAQKLEQKIRLIGISASNFRTDSAFLPLVTDKRHQRETSLDQTLDRIRNKFGNTSIMRADASHLKGDLQTKS
jgi:DNA polymerase-4